MQRSASETTLEDQNVLLRERPYFLILSFFFLPSIAVVDPGGAVFLGVIVGVRFGGQFVEPSLSPVLGDVQFVFHLSTCDGAILF